MDIKEKKPRDFIRGLKKTRHITENNVLLCKLEKNVSKIRGTLLWSIWVQRILLIVVFLFAIDVFVWEEVSNVLDNLLIFA